MSPPVTQAAPRSPRKHDDHDLPTETSCLLPGTDVEARTSNPANNNARQAPTPLPKVQLTVLTAVRVVDPVAYQQIFPYINQFLADLQVAKPAQVGFYSGLVESTYAFAQVLSVYQLGRISDVVGRRPVVLTCFICTAITTTLFGLSTSFAGVMILRFLAGLVGGNISVMHSILAEITDETNQDLAVPLYGLSFPIGLVIGPLIGGTLENAATRYPQYFGWKIFVEHPYLPPCIATALFALVAGVLAYVLIGETLPSKRKDAHGARASHAVTDSDEAEHASLFALWSIPAIRALTISGFALTYLNIAFDVVFLLVCYAPINAGGLGLTPSTIGNIFAFAGMVVLVLRALVTPYVLRRFDYAKTYNVCMYIWPVVFGLLPFLNILARAYPPSDTSLSGSASSLPSPLVLTGLLTLLALSKLGSIPWSVSMVLVKRHAPSASALGRSNGLVQLAMCIGRAVGPVTASTLFTGVNGLESVRRLGIGWAWAVVMVAIGVWGARVTRGIESR